MLFMANAHVRTAAGFRSQLAGYNLMKHHTHITAKVGGNGLDRA